MGGRLDRVGLAADIRRRAARIVAGARHVRMVEEALDGYAAGLPALDRYPPPAVDLPDAPPEQRAALHLQLDAINFGSGWFPTLRKRAGMSGSFTVMTALAEHGPWPAAELAAIDAADVARALGQDPGHELMALYAEHLRELARRAPGGFLALATRPALAEHLATWPTFRDPFFKRAQITAYDMVCAGFSPPGAEGDLTMFADNLVPHVLRLDGLLEYEPRLLARIERGELLDHGSPEEVEIRAAAVHAVTLLAARRADLSEPSIDAALWRRGQEPRYKAVPRHRARCSAY